LYSHHIPCKHYAHRNPIYFPSNFIKFHPSLPACTLAPIWVLDLYISHMMYKSKTQATWLNWGTNILCLVISQPNSLKFPNFNPKKAVKKIYSVDRNNLYTYYNITEQIYIYKKSRP
jgi:hypothetical protein